MEKHADEIIAQLKFMKDMNCIQIAEVARPNEELVTMVQVLAPLAIGMTVFVCHLVAIPIDGCR